MTSGTCPRTARSGMLRPGWRHEDSIDTHRHPRRRAVGLGQHRDPGRAGAGLPGPWGLRARRLAPERFGRRPAGGVWPGLLVEHAPHPGADAHAWKRGAARAPGGDGPGHRLGPGDPGRARGPVHPGRAHRHTLDRGAGGGLRPPRRGDRGAGLPRAGALAVARAVGGHPRCHAPHERRVARARLRRRLSRGHAAPRRGGARPQPSRAGTCQRRAARHPAAAGREQPPRRASAHLARAARCGRAPPGGFEPEPGAGGAQGGWCWRGTRARGPRGGEAAVGGHPGHGEQPSPAPAARRATRPADDGRGDEGAADPSSAAGRGRAHGSLAGPRCLPLRAGGDHQRGPARAGAEHLDRRGTRRGAAGAAAARRRMRGHGGEAGERTHRNARAVRGRRGRARARLGAGAGLRAARLAPGEWRVDMIRVALVDDQTLVRKGIRGLLETTEDIRVVAEASDGEEAVRVILQATPDLVLLDVRMPKRNGVEVLKDPRLAGCLPPTILLTTFDDDAVMLEGIRAGSRGFLLKDVSLERLTASIRAVARGESLMLPAVTERVLKGLKHIRRDFDSLELPDPLTRRETEVLRLMAGGYSNREIARALDTSEGTMKNHSSSILSKLGVRDRTRAVLRALELGCI